MIQPIYFPFTYVPQWVAETFATGFKHFCVYQPSGKDVPAEMQVWVEKNAMNICVPVPNEDENLTDVVNEFQRFARLHADDKNPRMAAFWNRQAAVPFFNETSASQIAADLKKDKTLDAGLAYPDTLLRARVFLEFAQEFDRYNAELRQELDVNDRRSEDLLANLSGQKDNDSRVTRLTAEIRVDDPGEYMAQARLQAWIRLFMEEPIDSGLLVTSSPSVFNYLVENLPPAEKILESKTLPAKTANDDWQDAFLNQMKHLVESEGLAAGDDSIQWPAGENNSANRTLTLYRLPGRSPAVLLGRILQSSTSVQNTTNQMPEIKNTLLGLIRQRTGGT